MPAIPQPVTTLKAQVHPARKSVLIIDDDTLNSDYLKQMLGGLGYCATVANSGQRGLSSVVKRRPDCILLDLHMPEMDGFDVLLELENTNEPIRIPVIVISCGSHWDDVQRALALGAVDYIVKPVEEGALACRLERFVPSPFYSLHQPSQVRWENVAKSSLL